MDVVTFGAPCQDLSVAGSRAGMKHEERGDDERKMTLGSLFAGQGGFELCAEEVGALPLWSSEIEKNAQAVLKYHWPEDDDESKRL